MDNLLQSKLPLIMLVLSLATSAVSACGAAPRGQDVAPAPEQVPAGQPVAPAQPTTEPEVLVEITGEPGGTPPPTQAAPPVPPAGGDLISFSVNGGILGLCDSLGVTAAGEYTWQTCRGQDSRTGALPDDELKMLQTWQDTLAGFTVKREDNPGGADQMVSE
ncbi:MAG: hypothetical protein AB1801_27185, partial [Chloroflexota bacterium]